ncbi:MAG: hypothetical protein M3R26_00885 [Actinomycetota bacterium]|nr:hypothetical protein [Actinomycetota bacterium]
MHGVLSSLYRFLSDYGFLVDEDEHPVTNPMLALARPSFKQRPNDFGADLGSSQAGYKAWLDEHDARVPLTRADLHSRADHVAERAVAAGGGMQAVIEATGLRTRENVLRLIDPAILDRAR